MEKPKDYNDYVFVGHNNNHHQISVDANRQKNRQPDVVSADDPFSKIPPINLIDIVKLSALPTSVLDVIKEECLKNIQNDKGLMDDFNSFNKEFHINLILELEVVVNLLKGMPPATPFHFEGLISTLNNPGVKAFKNEYIMKFRLYNFFNHPYIGDKLNMYLNI